MSLRILYVGITRGTSQHRQEALRALGHTVRGIPADQPTGLLARQLYRLSHRARRDVDLVGANRAIRAAVSQEPFDLLWVDKGLTIAPATLRWVRERQPQTTLVTYSPDDMFAPDLQSANWLDCVPLYDLHVTTKSFNVDELPALGARAVRFVNNAYDPEAHRPLELDGDERRRFAAPVGFAGTWEPERAGLMLRLAKDGVRVRIWGYGWRRMGERHANLEIHDEQLFGLDYARAINATDVNLGFLRKAYRDRQTTRSVEIPACDAFMLAERTDEHLALFEEGHEAEFFASYEELLEKCRAYVADPERRMQVAAAGRARCLSSGYDNASVLRPVVEELEARRG